MPRANLSGKVSLDDSAFRAGVRRVKMSAAGLGREVSKSFKVVGSALVGVAKNLARIAAIAATITFAAATAGAVAMGRAMKKAFDLGGRLSDLSAQTGIAVKELVLLQQAFEDNGVAGDKVGSVVNKMQRSISDLGAGLSTQVRAFDRLGLTFADIEGKSPLEQFRLVQKAIADIQDPTMRAATAMEIFGRSGGDMLALFADRGALDKAATTIGTQADILDRNAQIFDRISDLLASAGQKFQGFIVGVADIGAPAILEALEKFNAIDFADLGQRFGKAIDFDAIANFFTTTIPKIIGTVKDITQTVSAAIVQFYSAVTSIDYKGLFMAIAENVPIIMGQGLIKAAKDFGNLIFRTNAAAIAALGQALVEIGQNFVKLLGIIATGDFWKGVGNALLSAGYAFSAILQNATAKMLRQLSKIPGLGKLATEAADNLEANAAANNEEATRLGKQAALDLDPAFEEIKKGIADSLSRIKQAFTDGFKNAGTVFDTSSQSERIAEAVEKIMDAAAPKVKPPAAPGAPAAPAAAGGEAGGGIPDAVAARVKKIQELQATGFRGLADREIMQLERMAGIAPGTTTALNAGPKALNGRMGSISRAFSGGTPGGLGAARRVATSNDAKVAKRDETLGGTNKRLDETKTLLAKQNELLQAGLN